MSLVRKHPERLGEGVAGFLRERKEDILRAWEARVTSEARDIELEGPALRDDVPQLLDALADWLVTDDLPEKALLAATAELHVTQRLDAGLLLAQMLREYRLLRATILDQVLEAESQEQARAGPAGEGARLARISELARLNTGLDFVLSQSIEKFVEERDRRAEVDRVNAAHAVLESETKYWTLFDSIDQGFCVIEVLFEGELPVDYRFLEVNAAFERQTGLAKVKGRRIRELLPNIDQHWFDIYGRIAKTGVAQRFESVGRALGRVFDVYAFRVGEPAQRQVAVLFSDITGRKRTEFALRESEKLKAYLLELTDALRPLSDATAIHATLTRTARAHFGADRCFYFELENDTAIIRRDDAQEGLESIAGAYPLRKFPRYKAAVERGHPLVVEDATTSPLIDEDMRKLARDAQVVSFLDVPVVKEGKAIGVLCLTQRTQRTWTDSEIVVATETAERAWAAVEHAHTLTALRLANERLVEADRRKDEFLAVLSHELRNPLTPIRNSVAVIDRATPGSEKANRARQVIDRQVEHMARLVDDLLDVTRITRGKVVLRRERVDLNAIAKRTAEDHREVFAREGVELQIVDAGKPLWVDGDRTRLVQVIGNLLTNAAKFTPRGGKTVLTVGESGGRGVLHVHDTGVGMSKQTLGRLFEPFVQAEQSIERARGGLGLGLALVKGLMELHDGTVTARSEGEGKGAEFEVSLPLEVPARASASSAHRPAHNGKAQSVLVVEDNVDSADSLRDMLSLEGHEVRVAYSGTEGLKAAREDKPDIILCDLGLPGIDGYEVARSIRADAKLRDTYLIALSGYALPEDVSRARDAGFDRHIAKPPSIEAIERVLDEHSPKSASRSVSPSPFGRGSG